ncbi:FmdB family zinc ribbon protein [Coxiella burnetii]|uniref:Putative regulatory protein FmdB zinc ribbon domain-containing protein n=2 Tax=Coxiella burnetii TaxID=777 RepID=Q83BF2_COXBU|nr:FmdB family zinc ribbon protein [Coxiella burnetii]NP_820541.1 hypothetical protein CBU_1558 [Coxiella burnetii RSA 493]AAO91055.1 hypothetical protein CBU_1558 [Coxiella burnetii RSA 493]ABS77291.1 hypothetical protein CBUD_0428 [Coxiella burnetii Dugway 5J108-111]ABX78544.1 putative regulatory protein, FmdB family [Coxiella burnetii RSA 331]ACJ17879.1 hypothetical protein CbuG_0453 [Coxiella burnetii CbuG_Q212]ACJ20914.1 hypothetical protein CbuK_1786 [Coxiella burnetii CbuK_Q154]
MPIYEYQCEKCGEQTEVIQKINDSPVIDCPTCHEPALKRLISPAGFKLEGTGWYVTDFRDKDNKPKPEAASKPEKSKEPKKEVTTKNQESE